MDEDQKTPLISHKNGNATFDKMSKNGDDIDSKTLRPRRRKITRKITVEPLIVFCFMTFSATQPFNQQYIYYRLAEDAGLVDSLNQNNVSQCSTVDINDTAYILQQEVQAQASRFTLAVSFVYILPALFTSLLIGPYSDRAGRKKAMIPPLATSFLRAGVVAGMVFWKLPIWVLLPMMFLEGLSGSAMSLLAASFAYISDITDHSTRSRHMLILEICMGVGVTAAQIGMGHLISSLGFRWPVVILFILAGANLLYAIILVPETIIKDPHVTFFTPDHFKKIFSIYTIDDQYRRKWRLRLTLLIFSITSVTDIGAMEVQTLYFLNSPLCWTSILIGYFNGVTYLIKNLSSVAILGLCFKRVGDLGLVLMGLLSSISYNILLPFATRTLFAFLAAIAAFASMLTGVMLRSSASKLVHPDEQGALFASQGWFQLLSGMVGAVAFNGIYSSTLYIAHGFVFFVAAGMMTIAFILSAILLHGSKKHSHTIVFDEKEVLEPTKT